MASVGTITFFEDGVHNYFTLSNREQYLRTFNVPATGWNTMNIGILVSADTAVAPSTGSGLWLGLTTSGQPGVGFKQVTYNNFSAVKRMMGWGLGFGIGYVGTFGATLWTHTSMSRDISGSFITSGGGYGYANSGSSVSAGGDVTPAFIPTTQDIPRKVIMCTSVRKNSAASYGSYGYWCQQYSGSTGTNHNHTFETLFATICQGLAFNGTRLLDGVNMYNIGQSLTVQPTDDANFPLDTINIYVTGSVTFRIHGVAVAIVN